MADVAIPCGGFITVTLHAETGAALQSAGKARALEQAEDKLTKELDTDFLKLLDTYSCEESEDCKDCSIALHPKGRPKFVPNEAQEKVRGTWTVRVRCICND